jgi:polysaccharide deacetylase family protein (PEP-CTERM system associated)
MHNALTIDLEEWYHPELVRPHLPKTEHAAQIEQSTQQLLQLLRQRETKATFFVLGEVARHHPRLIQVIAAEGHELGCHGMQHTPLWKMTPERFRAELRQFAAVIQETVPGAQVVGFRAPTFSLDNRSGWALAVLAEFGYHYDSSVFPLRNPVYGVNGTPLAPYRPSPEDLRVVDRSAVVVEFPMSVWSWAGIKLPVCGGAYLRILPEWLIRACLRRINQERPFVIYVHPWETYPLTQRLPLPFASRLVTYHNLGRMSGRLERLLGQFSFAPMRTVLAEMGEV